MTDLSDLLQAALKRHDLQLVSYILEVASHPISRETIDFEDDFLNVLIEKNNSRLTDLTILYWTTHNYTKIFEMIVYAQNQYALRLFFSKFKNFLKECYDAYKTYSRFGRSKFSDYLLWLVIRHSNYDFPLHMQDVGFLLNNLYETSKWKDTFFKYNAQTICLQETTRNDRVDKFYNRLDKILYTFQIPLYDRNVTRIIADYFVEYEQ